MEGTDMTISNEIQLLRLKLLLPPLLRIVKGNWKLNILIWPEIDPPRQPTISGVRIGSIREGSLYQLGCMSLGGNPPASLKWFLAGSRKEVLGNQREFWAQDWNKTQLHIDTTPTYQIKSNYTIYNGAASSELELTAKREDNGKELRCEATNSALDGTLVETTQLKIECKFGCHQATECLCVFLVCRSRFVDTKEWKLGTFSIR